jgi:hypothetical protein
MTGTKKEENTIVKTVKQAIDEHLFTKDDGRLVRDVNGVKLSIYDAGTYKDVDPNSDTFGQEIAYEQGIKLGSGKFNMKLSAVQLATIKAMFEDPEVNAELKRRLVEEKKTIETLSF